jgi:hypothetical protein
MVECFLIYIIIVPGHMMHVNTTSSGSFKKKIWKQEVSKQHTKNTKKHTLKHQKP